MATEPERASRRIGPHLFWHAAALEQLDPAAMLGDPDAAARALVNAARLYGVDVLPAVPVDMLALAVRGVAQPGAPAAMLHAQQQSGAPFASVPTSDDIVGSPPVDFIVAVVQRLDDLAPSGTEIAVTIPTAELLAQQLGGQVDADELDPLVGAALREIGAAEPALVIRVGPGPRVGMASGICSFFGIGLIEATDGESDEVSAPHGDDFVGAQDLRGAFITTSTELPAGALPAEVTACIRNLRNTES